MSSHKVTVVTIRQVNGLALSTCLLPGLDYGKKERAEKAQEREALLGFYSKCLQ